MHSMDSQHLGWNRKFVLEPMEGKTAKSSVGGGLDPRLFSGENNLIGTKDIETCLWTLKYERGIIPGALKDQTFTSFTMMKKFVEEYYKKRNVRVKEIKD